MCPPSDLDVVAVCYTMSHFLSLDMLSLSTNQKDAFYATLVMLTSTFKVPQSKVFILKALVQTSYVFPTLDRSLKSNMKISSKVDALKRQKIEFEQAQLTKKQATHRLSELCTEYDAHKERIKVLIEEVEKEKAKLTSFVKW